MTNGKSGKTSLLDIDMPRPVSMNCLNRNFCIAVFELNVHQVAEEQATRCVPHFLRRQVLR